MENTTSKPKKKKKKRAGRVIFLISLLGMGLAGAVLVSQQAKLRSIEREQEQLLEEITFQEEEMARMEYMIEYSRNEAYLIQYAREKLGYIKPEEIKFDIAE